MDQLPILNNIYKSKILNYIIIDYDKYENNSNVLILLNSTIKSLLTTNNESKLADKLLFDLNILQIFSNKLDHKDFILPMTTRKDIFPFIHNLTSFLQQMCEINPELKSKIYSEPHMPYWNNMLDKFNESQTIFKVEWGAAKDIEVVPNDITKDVIRKHEQ